MEMANIFRDSVNQEKIKFRNKEYNNLKKTKPNISFQKAYDLLEGPEYCICCGRKARFVSLKLGYSKYCSEKCYDIDNGYDLPTLIDRIKKGWNPTPKNFIKIKNIHNLNTKQLYDLIYGPGKCEHCGSEPSFVNFKQGYLKYCCVSCSNHYKDYKRTKEQNDIIQEKRKKTCLSKYGVDHNFKLLDKSGTKNIMHKDNCSELSLNAKKNKKKTMLDRYGRTAPYEAYYITNRKNLTQEYIMENFIENNKFDIQSAMLYYNCSRTYFNKFDLPKKLNIGEEWIYSIIGGKRNDRTIIKPLELDILNEEYQIGVEYNGLMFHSSGKSTHSTFNNPKYICKHLFKTNECEKKDIQLFHIFENEFLDTKKRCIWGSVLNSKLNKTNRIFARKCQVQEIDNSLYREFCEKNHLQGFGNASVKIGLFYESKLVSIMSFGKSRYNKSVDWELIRFCSELNTTVVGGASKLLKYFERTYQPKSIISYANRRWSQGYLYEKLGFEFIENTNPNYFYFLPNENILYSRVKYQKHKLKDKLDVFDPKLSETENMYNNGYRKIYDCGNKKYIKKY